MIRPACLLKARISAPYVYFIAKERFLYIGETQKIPVSRLAAHLQPDGSFSQHLIKRDEEIYRKNLPIRFFAYELSDASSLIPKADEKLLSQYIEHQLHILYVLERRLLRPIEEILSDTEKTAPRGVAYPQVHPLIESIFSSFINEYQAVTQ